MKKTDIAYMAGIFDGEGCIAIHDRKYARKDGTIATHAYAEINFANTNEWVVRHFLFNFGGNVYLRKKQTGSTQPIWAWQICSKASITPLKILLPFLKIKHEQAKIALAFQTQKNPTNRQPLSILQEEEQSSIKRRISFLNRPFRKKEGET